MPRKPRPPRPRLGNNPAAAARRALSGGAQYRANPAAIKAARSAIGMSQERLASESSCSKGMVSHIESGRREVVTGALARAITTALTGDATSPLSPFFMANETTSQGRSGEETQPLSEDEQAWLAGELAVARAWRLSELRPYDSPEDLAERMGVTVAEFKRLLATAKEKRKQSRKGRKS